MYSKFSPYKINSTENPEEIYDKILSRKRTGLDFHNKMYLLFKLLNMSGFAKEQKYRFYDELKDYLKCQKHYMKKFGKVPHIQFEEITLDPYNISQLDITKLTGDKKSVIIKYLFDEWKKWECETLELLSEQEDVVEIEKELEKLEKQIIEYNDVNWCIKYLYNKQHYLKEKYKEKIEKMG